MQILFSNRTDEVTKKTLTFFLKFVTTTHSIFLKFAGGQNLPKGNIEMKLVTTTNATVKIDQQFVSFETERSVQTASCLEAGSNLTTKN